MAVVAKKSGAITNRDTVPKVKTNANVLGGTLKGFAGTLEIASGDSTTSTLRFAQVPSNARMHSLLLWSDDIGSASNIDVGLYDTTENGGAVVDVDFFASAVDNHSGALNAVDITHEAAANNGDIANGEKMIWQALGLTSDPKKFYDVTATIVTADANGAGTVTLKGSYVD